MPLFASFSEQIFKVTVIYSTFSNFLHDSLFDWSIVGLWIVMFALECLHAFELFVQEFHVVESWEQDLRLLFMISAIVSFSDESKRIR